MSAEAIVSPEAEVTKVRTSFVFFVLSLVNIPLLLAISIIIFQAYIVETAVSMDYD